jgi:hypothetical protein
MTGAPGTRCKAPRPNGAVFCPSCGFNFAGESCAERYGTAPAPATAAVRKSGGPGVGVLFVGLLVVAGAIFSALAILPRGTADTSTPQATSATSRIPPIGKIWFGSSFDTETLEVSGRLSTVTANQGFSLVAHLPKDMEATALLIRTSWNGDLVATTPVNAAGSGELWGLTPGPLYAAGEWRYDMTDIGGNVLATGTITATE